MLKNIFNLFTTPAPLTLGIEEEYFLLRFHDIYIQGHMPLDMYRALEDFGPEHTLAHELFDSHLEARTAVCPDMSALKAALMETRQTAANFAGTYDLHIAAAGTVPAVLWQNVKVLPHEGYEKIAAMYGEALQCQSIAALHIHVGVGSEKKSRRLVRAMQPYLWIFLALSGSSRFYDGRDTGISSRRYSLIGQTNRTGLPPDIFPDTLTQIILPQMGWSEKKLWHGIRYNPQHKTVELRICDAVARREDVLALAALFQTLSHWLLAKGLPTPDQEEIFYAKENIDRAMRAGTQTGGEYFYPENMYETKAITAASRSHLINIYKGQTPCTLEEGLVRLIAYMEKSAQKLGTLEHLNHLLCVAKEGNPSSRYAALRENETDAPEEILQRITTQ